MKKYLFTCFLALPCLFQKARIKFKAIKERLGLPGSPTPLRYKSALTHLAAGISHAAQRSVSRGAYLSAAIFHRLQGGVFHSDDKGGYFAQQYFGAAISREAYFPKKSAWIGTYALIPILLCSSISPTLSLVAQSPGAKLLHRSESPNRGGPISRPDSFTILDPLAESFDKAIYTTDVSAIDGGPALRSAVSHLPASTKETASLRAFARSDDPLHWESVLSTVKASDIGHRTPDIKLNFGLVDSDQGNEEGKEASNFHSSSVPVFTEPVHSSQKSHSQSTEAQSLASCVLSLASKNGLVDSDQDMRVGFKASILKSPSVPVFSSQIKQELARQAPESQSLASCFLCLASKKSASVPVLSNQIKQELARQVPESQCLVSSFLLLASTSNLASPVRSEVEACVSCAERSRSMRLASKKSASPESHPHPVTDTSEVRNAYIYGEVASSTPNDTAYISVWPRFIHEKQWNPAPVQMKFPLQIGNLFEGSYGKRVFEFTLPVTDSVSVFSLSLDRYPILENYLLEAGDSIKVLIDLRKGQTLFVGPSGAKYQAQHLIYQALEASRQDQDPVMVSTPAGVERMVARNPEMYQKALLEKSSLRKSIRFIQTRADSLFLISSQKVDFPFRHPAWVLYESQKQIIGAQFAQIIPSRIIAHQLLPFFRSARSYSDLGQPVFEQLPTQIAALTQARERYGWDPRAPELIELLLHERYLTALETSTKLFPQFDQMDPEIRDRLYARYLVSTIEHRAMSREAFEHADHTVSSPWIRELIFQMQNHLVVGANLSPHTFIGMDGIPIGVKDLEGKLVLINFWLSGCTYSEAEFEKVIRPTQEHFKDNDRVVFLSASADPRQSVWKNTVESGELTSDYSLSVYAGPDHPMIRGMGIHSYPRKVLLDPRGRLLGFQDLPRNAKDLIQLLEQELASIQPIKTQIQ